MSNKQLRVCPTCLRDFDDETRFNMGLRTGKLLNRMCPGANGPSDIDHVLHNGRDDRLLFLEYKGTNGSVDRGQQILHDALRDKGARVEVLDSHPPDPAAVLLPLAQWVWPKVDIAAQLARYEEHERRVRTRYAGTTR